MPINTLPKQATGKVFINARRTLDDNYEVTLHTCDMTDYGYTTLAVEEITLDIPDNVDFPSKEIEGLERLKRETEAKLHQIDERLKSLHCLEHMESIS